MKGLFIFSRRAAIFAAASMIAAGVVAPARAHSFLVEANPSSKDHVATAPKAVKLRFGGGVEPKYSKLSIEDASGKVLGEGANGVPDKPRELSMDAPELAAGKYVVRYRVLSTDGHIVEGSYEFTVDPK
ncbi:copper resistance CopC family protein [Methylocystis iwaonis]|uniref:copper resistance CopC family protein n=1 Tax=Methylocystis iwaonis TaxID=2885079 RepID=UPI002E7BB9C3|nr:copper resistance CopC family protein [Methylocystis iwaonis]